jgi:hypothetical protein
MMNKKTIWNERKKQIILSIFQKRRERKEKKRRAMLIFSLNLFRSLLLFWNDDKNLTMPFIPCADSMLMLKHE